MDLVYFSHAVERMQLRNITSAEVQLVVQKPEGKIKQSMDKWIYYKRLKDRKDNLIAAVILIRENEIEVLTIMNFFEVKK